MRIDGFANGERGGVRTCRDKAAYLPLIFTLTFYHFVQVVARGIFYFG